MAPDRSAPSEVQEQSIRSRKDQLYEASPDGAPRTVGRSVQDYLRETPATPLSKGLKLTLWGTGALVALLFVAVLIVPDRRPPKKPQFVGIAPPIPARSNKGPTPPPGAPAKTSLAAATPAKESTPKEPAPTKKKGKEKAKEKAASPEPAKPPEPIDPGKVAWHVAADPPAQAPDAPTGQEVSIQVPLGEDAPGRVLYPTAPSPFVAVGDNRDDESTREVWDLRTSRRLGLFRGKLEVGPPFALSPDGASFAARHSGGGSVGIWSFLGQREIRRIETPEAADFLDFAGADRVVTGTVGHWAFRAWDVRTGKRAVEIQVPADFDRESPAVSPGRKYLALTTLSDGHLWVFDLATGTPAGTSALPKDVGAGWSCQGLTFSADGKELAAVFEASAGKPRLLCWDLADGKAVADLDLERYDLKRARDDQGRAVEWLPDGTGWLVYGQAIIDRKSGQKVFELPPYAPDAPPAPRRMLDADRALIAQGRGRSLAIRTVPLPREQIAKVQERVQAGEAAVDAVLPPARAADRSLVRQVPAPADSWSVGPDPLRLARPLIGRPIELKNTLDEVKQILFSAPEAGQAIVAIRTIDRNQAGASGLAGGQSLVLERYDVASNGRRLGQNNAPAVCDLLAFSPDGGRVLLRDTENRDRLDVYAAADQRHQAGWRPYGDETGEDRMVTWAAFLDPSRVLTINPAGTLMLWTVPDCRALYVAKETFRGAPALSPGRKYLAGSSGGAIRVVDPASGRQLGDSMAPRAAGGGQPGALAVAFRPDGQQLAALLDGGLVVRLDLKDGKVLSEFRVPGLSGGQLQWSGPDYLLVDGRSLVDLEAQAEVWRYAGGVPAQESPDGRSWAAVERFANRPAYLAAFTLPEKGVERVVAQATDKKAQALLRPGGAVGLKVEAPRAPGGSEGFRQAVSGRFAGQLEAGGIKVADGQPVSLVIKVDELDAGEMKELRAPQPAAKAKAKAKAKKAQNAGKNAVLVKNLEYEVTLADASGGIPLEPKQTIRMRDLGEVDIPADVKDPAEFLRGRMWDLVKTRLASVAVPSFAARDPSGAIVRLPGTTNLGQLMK